MLELLGQDLLHHAWYVLRRRFRFVWGHLSVNRRLCPLLFPWSELPSFPSLLLVYAIVAQKKIAAVVQDLFVIVLQEREGGAQGLSRRVRIQLRVKVRVTYGRGCTRRLWRRHTAFPWCGSYRGGAEQKEG